MACLTLTVRNLPSHSLAFTNMVFMAEESVSHLCGSNSCFIDINGHIFAVQGHSAILDSEIAMNKLQRQFAQFPVGGVVRVNLFEVLDDYTLGCCAMKIDLLIVSQHKPRPKFPLEMQHAEMVAIVKRNFQGQFLSACQPLVLEFDGHWLKLVVDECWRRSADEGKPSAARQGLVGSETKIFLLQGSLGQLHIPLQKRVVQLSASEVEMNSIHCVGLSGDELAYVTDINSTSELKFALKDALQMPAEAFDAVLPCGELLARQSNTTSVWALFQYQGKWRHLSDCI